MLVCPGVKLNNVALNRRGCELRRNPQRESAAGDRSKHKSGVSEMDYDNPFELFESEPGWEEATRKLARACVNAAEDIATIQDQYENCGAKDTASYEAIVSYLLERMRAARYRPED
jgi:hypothetical protein